MDKKEAIQKEVAELLGKLGINTAMTVSKEDNSFQVQIEESEESSILIGKYGSTLKALQIVIDAILYKQFGDPVNVLINVGDYRERQKERVEGIAENVAQRVRQDQKPYSLSSFSSYERKLVHEYITQNHPDLTSQSEGEGRDRKLIIRRKDNEL